MHLAFVTERDCRASLKAVAVNAAVDKESIKMEIASVIFEHGFDQGLLEQINTLRCMRLDMAEKMLLDLEGTSRELKRRGLVGVEDVSVSKDDLRGEILSRITTLKERMNRPEVVFADEISLFVDLLQAEANDERGVLLQ